MQKNCIVIGQVIVPGASYADYAMVYLTVKFDNPGIQMQVNDENRSCLNCFIETQTQPRLQNVHAWTKVKFHTVPQRGR